MYANQDCHWWYFTHTHTHPLCLAIYGFIQNTRPHVLLQRTEWLQPAENLHGNKSYNLSPVCTLDWLKAITLTKKAFPPFFLFLLPALCQINPLNFLKDLCLFFSCLRMKTLSIFFSILLVCRYGTWNRRLLSDWNSCQEFPSPPTRLLALCSTWPLPHLSTLLMGETGNCTRFLSCLGGILAGAEWWEGGGGAWRVGALQRRTAARRSEMD